MNTEYNDNVEKEIASTFKFLNKSDSDDDFEENSANGNNVVEDKKEEPTATSKKGKKNKKGKEETATKKEKEKASDGKVQLPSPNAKKRAWKKTKKAMTEEEVKLKEIHSQIAKAKSEWEVLKTKVASLEVNVKKVRENKKKAERLARNPAAIKQSGGGKKGKGSGSEPEIVVSQSDSKKSLSVVGEFRKVSKKFGLDPTALFGIFLVFILIILSFFGVFDEKR